MGLMTSIVNTQPSEATQARIATRLRLAEYRSFLDAAHADERSHRAQAADMERCWHEARRNLGFSQYGSPAATYWRGRERELWVGWCSSIAQANAAQRLAERYIWQHADRVYGSP